MLVHCLIVMASIMNTGECCNRGEMKHEILAATINMLYRMWRGLVSGLIAPCGPVSFLLSLCLRRAL
jgi:hypothetical protein